MPVSVLVADDQQDARTILRRRLERRGYAVTEATDGAEAVAHTVNWAPDLIIMDISMPRMDGIEAWRMICELTSAPPPAIALTVVCVTDVRLTCLDLGFKAFLNKPVEFEELTALMRTLVPHQGTGDI